MLQEIKSQEQPCTLPEPQGRWREEGPPDKQPIKAGKEAFVPARELLRLGVGTPPSEMAPLVLLRAPGMWGAVLWGESLQRAGG